MQPVCDHRNFAECGEVWNNAGNAAAGIQKQRVAVFDIQRGELRNAVFCLHMLARARENAQLAVAALHKDRAAMAAAQKPRTLKLHQVAPDRCGADVKRGAQLRYGYRLLLI